MRTVARLDTAVLTKAARDVVLAVVRGAGLDPRLVRNTCSLKCTDNGLYQLHVAEMLTNKAGRKYVDLGTNQVASRVVVIEVAEDIAQSLMP